MQEVWSKLEQLLMRSLQAAPQAAEQLQQHLVQLKAFGLPSLLAASPDQLAATLRVPIPNPTRLHQQLHAWAGVATSLQQWQGDPSSARCAHISSAASGGGGRRRWLAAVVGGGLATGTGTARR